MSSVISVANLVKSFETPLGNLEILDDVTLLLDRNENLAVIGPSGSGKSTLLHIIGTLDQPTSGTVELLGQDVSDMDEPSLAGFRNANIGFVFQEHYLLPQLTARENVLIPALARGTIGSLETARANDLLAQVGLQDRSQHRPGQLSGGERQRVAVARALMNQPTILLADEPTGSLDQATAESVGRLLLDLQRAGQLTLVCVTHNDALAGQFGRQVRLDSGRLVPVD